MDHLKHTSMGNNRNISKELGDASAGWWNDSLKGFTRILFIRDNVVVNISLFLMRFIEEGGSTNTTMEIAKAIDAALVSGTLGVQRGKTLKVPRILTIDTPKELISRSKGEVTVRIAVPENPQDQSSKDIEIVRTLSFYLPNVSSEETSGENKTFNYEMTYISSGCLTVSKQLQLTVKTGASSR